MIDYNKNTKCKIEYTTCFKKQLKKIIKQGKDVEIFCKVIEMLANREKLPSKYKNHNLINDNTYRDCMECHLKPDWLLIYKYIDNNLVLLLVSTGSHSEILNKY